MGPDVTLEDWGMTMAEFEAAYYAGQSQKSPRSKSLSAMASDEGPPIWESDYGTGLQLADDDCRLVDLGFTFTFYGNAYSEVWVNTNGNMTFNGCNTRFWPTNIPDGENIIIAPIYGDFVPEVTGSDVYVNTIGSSPNRIFVATWLEINAWNWPGTNTFQAILSEGANTIIFGYNGLTTNGINNINDRDMNVGISSGTGRYINSATREEIPDLDMTNICYRPEGGDYLELFGSCYPPIAVAGPDQTVECEGDTTTVTLDGTASTDPDGDPLNYSWTLSGTEIATGPTPVIPLDMGRHPVVLTVTNPDGDTGRDTVMVDIVDTTPPDLSYTVHTTELWPANHKRYLAVSGISTSDICDTDPLLSVSVSSSAYPEPVEPSPYWSIEEQADGTVDVYLQAESGQQIANIYTVSIRGEDASGNWLDESVEVTVPHSMGKGRK